MYISRSVLMYISRSLMYISRSVLMYISRSLMYISRSLMYISRSLMYISRSLMYISRSLLIYIRWSFLHHLNIGFNTYNGGFMWNRANVYGGSTFVLLWSPCIVLHKSMYVRIVNTNFIVYIRYIGSSDGQDEWSSENWIFSDKASMATRSSMCGYFKMLPISCVVYSNIWSLEYRNFKENLLALNKDVYPHTYAHNL